MQRYLLAAFVAIAAWPALGQNAVPSGPHLSVSGKAFRKVQPDRFSIELKVEAIDIKPLKARTRVEKRMADILAGFKANHALPDSVDASAISVGAQQQFRDGWTMFAGTKVSRTARATFSTLADLRGFIDATDTDNELQITNTSVTRSDIDAIHRALRHEAIEDSIRSAKAMADAYGVRLGSLYTVSDASPGYSVAPPAPPAPPADLGMSARPSIDLKVGSIEVDELVYATFLMDPAQ